MFEFLGLSKKKVKHHAKTKKPLQTKRTMRKKYMRETYGNPWESPKTPKHRRHRKKSSSNSVWRSVSSKSK